MRGAPRRGGSSERMHSRRRDDDGRTVWASTRSTEPSALTRAYGSLIA